MRQDQRLSDSNISCKTVYGTLSMASICHTGRIQVSLAEDLSNLLQYLLELSTMSPIKATFQLEIFDLPVRTMCEDQMIPTECKMQFPVMAWEYSWIQGKIALSRGVANSKQF